ncbi:MAG: response regulator [Bdellovibrionales bacterium]
MSNNTFKPLKLVLVEDSEDLSDLLREFFSLDGHEVKCYLTGHGALQNEPVIKEADLLITDYYLPDMNGMDVIRAVRAIHPTLPVILLSGGREPSVLESLRTLPQASFLSKPVDIDDLEARVNELVGVRK